MTLTASTSCLRILTNTPYLTFESLSEVIGTLGGEARIADSLKVAANEGSMVLVITSRPTYVLAAYLQSALNMRSALAQWIEWAEYILLYQRKNRRNITLVDLELLTRGDTKDFDRLKSRVNIDFSRLSVSFNALRPRNDFILLANAGINADYRAATLAQELEAAMFCPSEDSNMIDLAESVLEDLRNNNKELSLHRETMALQLNEIERQARLLLIEEQKTLKATESSSRENALASQLRKAQNRIEALSTSKQKHLAEFSRILAQMLHKKELMRWPWMSRRAWQIGIIRDCGVVDVEWYLQHHQDVANAGADPFRHYIDYGVKEGRPPNRDFL